MTVMEFGKQNPEIAILLHGGGLSWWNYRDAAEILAEDACLGLKDLAAKKENADD